MYVYNVHIIYTVYCDRFDRLSLYYYLTFIIIRLFYICIYIGTVKSRCRMRNLHENYRKISKKINKKLVA